MDTPLTQIGPNDLINLAYVVRVLANVATNKPNPNHKDGDPINRVTDAVAVYMKDQRDPIYLFDDNGAAFLKLIAWKPPAPVTTAPVAGAHASPSLLGGALVGHEAALAEHETLVANRPANLGDIRGKPEPAKPELPAKGPAGK